MAIFNNSLLARFGIFVCFDDPSDPSVDPQILQPYMGGMAVIMRP